MRAVGNPQRQSLHCTLNRLAGCCSGTMEEKSKDDTAKEQEAASSSQRKIWKNFPKPFLSPKLRRSGEGKKESGLWMFKRKKKQVLDRVFSSSQPNLSCSTQARFEGDKSLGGKLDPDSASGLSVSPLVTADGASTSRLQLPGHGSPKLAVSHLVMSHQKSSSLGSACFEKLVVDSGASSEDELGKHASDSVSGCLQIV